MLSQFYFVLQSLIASVFCYYISFFPLKAKTNQQTLQKANVIVGKILKTRGRKVVWGKDDLTASFRISVLSIHSASSLIPVAWAGTGDGMAFEALET